MKTKIEIANRLWVKSKKFPLLRGGVALLCLAGMLNGTAQTYTILHTFGTNAMGLYPYAPLAQGPDGTLYGAAAEGGQANMGQVFKVNPDGSGYTALKDFTGVDGANPGTRLVLSGATLFGTAGGGGSNGGEYGTVFKINTDGSRFAVLKEFDGGDGAYPHGDLIIMGDTLFGTTAYGGGYGSVFKVNTDGSGYVVLKSFTRDDGMAVYAGLVLSGSELYGVTSGGGSNDVGTVFKLNTDGSGYRVLKHFNGAEGAGPEGSLAVEGTTLYGSTVYGGTNDYGTVFKLNTDGSSFAVLKHFNGSDGANSCADLVVSGTTLFGTTSQGGSSGNGIVFKLSIDGSDFTVLKELSGADGSFPYAGLVLSNTTLYGTASEGGNHTFGTVFKLEADGSDYAVVTHFAGGDGASPDGLTLSGTNVYGTTSSGGGSACGTVFKIADDGTGYTVLKDFTNSMDGANPCGSPLVSGTTVYGAAAYGGSSGIGSVFKVNTDGSGYTLLKDFTNSADGVAPRGSLVLSEIALYGTTGDGGISNHGTVFKINTDGTGYAVLRHFNGSDGRAPGAGVVLSGVTLYGTTSGGGSNELGVIFKINIDGSDFTLLKDFAGADGANPAGLALNSTSLYGTTEGGGAFGCGTVFKINTDGTGYTILKNFQGGNDGFAPHGLASAGATLYGVSEGGIFGGGTVFQISTDGGNFAVLKHFAGGADGAFPVAAPVWSGTMLIGTAVYGGNMENGVLFSLSPGRPIILVQPESNPIPAGSTADFQVEATGWPTPEYQWFFKGTNAIAGATSPMLELTIVQVSASGAYTVVVSNSYGSVTSLVATLTVQDPYLNNQPDDQSANAGESVWFTVDVVGTSPFGYQWLKLGLQLNDGGNISGAQTATLTLSNVLGGDADGYSVIVNSANGSVTSSVASLSVQDPFIITHPASRSVNVGQGTSFGLVAKATAPFSYQWRKAGAALAGATSASLTIDAARAANAGGYDVVVNNLFGSVTSQVAVLTVNMVVVDPFSPAFSSDPGVTSRAQTLVVQPDGKILVGGRFTPPGGQTGSGLVRLNADGTLDTTFTPMPYGYVYGLILQPDGKILAGGSFWISQGGQSRSCLARLNANGSLDPTFNASADNVVYCLASQPDGKVMVGGQFAHVAGEDRACLARLNADGTLDTSFNPGSTNSVRCLAVQSDGKIIVGGSFWWLAGQRCDQFGRLNCDGTLDTSYHPPGYNSSINWLALQKDDRALVGFGASFNRLNVDGTRDASFNPMLNNPVLCSAIQPDGRILIGGIFTTLDGEPHEYIGRLNANGSVDSTFSPGANSWVQCIARQPDGSILVGGDFTMLGGQPRTYIGRLVEYGPPNILAPMQDRTAEAGAAVCFSVYVTGSPPPSYQWFCNDTNALLGCTNTVLPLTDLQFAHSGAYTVGISNAAGAVTSAPVLLSVIAPVERRMVPGLSLTSDGGSALQLDYTEALAPGPTWLSLATVPVADPLQRYFDVTVPLPTQRFYRASQVGGPGAILTLNLQMIPALTLAGHPGNLVRVDGINAVGPTAAWFTLGTVTLTNATQLYFDITAPGQPRRLYRLVPVP